MENKPFIKMKVIWGEYNCIIQKIKYRNKIAKIIPDYNSNKTMPYQYFWVDFNEIGF